MISKENINKEIKNYEKLQNNFGKKVLEILRKITKPVFDMEKEIIGIGWSQYIPSYCWRYCYK